MKHLIYSYHISHPWYLLVFLLMCIYLAMPVHIQVVLPWCLCMVLHGVAVLVVLCCVDWMCWLLFYFQC